MITCCKGEYMAKTKDVTKRIALIQRYFGKSTATAKKIMRKELNEIYRSEENMGEKMGSPPRIV
jgi:hypothetical protein